jgi:dTDP-4-amino-4,6-dideoxygalactose transaminase
MPTAEQILPYLREIDANKRYTNFGPLNDRFEQRIIADVAPHLDASNITTVSNCTVGLELALQANGLGHGARVLLPSLTFVATATAITRVGMIPVFTDVDAHSWCLTPDIAAKNAAEVDAIMPVSTFGCPHDMDAWDAFSQKWSKPVIVDAAGGYGNQGAGKVVDVVFSFHATKSFGAGEGGAILSPSSARIADARRLANFGIDTSTSLLVELGTNGKMSEYHGAVGLAMYDQWESVKRERRELLVRYHAILAGYCPDIVLQNKPVHGVYPLMSILLPRGILASKVAQGLAHAGIDSRRWYSPPLHLHPILIDLPTTGQLKVSEELGQRILGLPFHTELTDPDIQLIASCLRETIDATPKVAWP